MIMLQNGLSSFISANKTESTVCERKPTYLSIEKVKPKRQKRDVITDIMSRLKVNFRDVLYIVSLLAGTDSTSGEKQVPSPRPSTSMTPWATCRTLKLINKIQSSLSSSKDPKRSSYKN